MGHWFGKSSKRLPWRKTPTKIGNKWYTPNGERIWDPGKYFEAVDENGEYWKGDTGWRSKKH